MFRELYTFLGAGRPDLGCNIIKQRHDQLAEQGDASFPLDMTVWRRFIKNQEEGDHLQFDEQELIHQSQDWKLPVQRVVRIDNSCRIYFHRTKAIRKYFNLKRESSSASFFDPTDKPIDSDINAYRRRIVNESHKRLLTIHKANGQSLSEDLSKIAFKIGSCFDSDTKKPFPLTTQHYLSKRSTDMQLIAQHKYGLRMQNEKYLKDLVALLGAAAVTVDLLEARTSGPVFLATKSNQATATSSKGASFILYNSARIETLFRVFEERLQCGYYPPVPEVIDWSLLCEENEWKLFYNFLVEYEDVLQRTVCGKEIQIHNLCSFLYKLVGQFSVYYRRTKILTVSGINYKHLPYLSSFHFRRIAPTCCLSFTREWHFWEN